ncbi:MAG: hypothetical protein ACI4JQ_02015 [Ruminococcus sp.]
MNSESEKYILLRVEVKDDVLNVKCEAISATGKELLMAFSCICETVLEAGVGVTSSMLKKAVDFAASHQDENVK